MTGMDIANSRPMGDMADAGRSRRKKNKRSRRKRKRRAADIDADLNSVFTRLNGGEEGKVKMSEVISEVSTVMRSHIEALKEEVQSIQHPQGTRDNPAVSCREIKMGHPSKPSGHYWVDPNLGSIDDAIHVWCNMTQVPETCVSPSTRTTQADEKAYDKKKKSARFSQLQEGFSGIRYPSSIQLDFLRLLAEEATQTFEYHCTESVAWFDAASDSYEKAISLVGANDFLFDTRELPERRVLHDGCQNKEANGKTVFEITTSRVNRLPIVDFVPTDYGEASQRLGYKAGPVCFR